MTFTGFPVCVCRLMKGTAPFPGFPTNTVMVYGAGFECGVYVGSVKRADRFHNEHIRVLGWGRNRDEERKSFVAPRAGIIGAIPQTLDQYHT